MLRKRWGIDFKCTFIDWRRAKGGWARCVRRTGAKTRGRARWSWEAGWKGRASKGARRRGCQRIMTIMTAHHRLLAASSSSLGGGRARATGVIDWFAIQLSGGRRARAHLAFALSPRRSPGAQAPVAGIALSPWSSSPVCDVICASSVVKVFVRSSKQKLPWQLEIRAFQLHLKNGG